MNTEYMRQRSKDSLLPTYFFVKRVSCEFTASSNNLYLDHIQIHFLSRVKKRKRGRNAGMIKMLTLVRMLNFTTSPTARFRIFTIKDGKNLLSASKCCYHAYASTAVEKKFSY